MKPTPSDYDRIATAIAFIADRVNAQPGLRDIADHVHLSPYHFQRLFCRWAGVTPKRFLQILTVERAKQLLRESRSLLEVSESVGLSSGSRLYDHFVHIEAATPGEYRAAGAGMIIQYGTQDTPFGKAFIAITARGICALTFLDRETMDEPLATLRAQWPRAEMQQGQSRTQTVITALFSRGHATDQPLSVLVSGTNFQISVWKALLQIPPGTVASYSQVATAIGRPGAARAVGTAASANPVAFLIPCHRVIRESGNLGGYRWGATRKHAMHAWEAAKHG